MIANDFEYDGISLSSLGFTFCDFDSGGLKTSPNGAEITFSTVPVLNGYKHEIINSKYDTCLETTFQICKNPCNYNNELEIIPEDELRYISKWLGRKKNLKLKIVDVTYFDIFFEGRFDSVNRIELDGRLYGIELHFTSNAPFASGTQKKVTLKGDTANWKASITDVSDEEGYIYPQMEIELKSGGNLTIQNALDGKTTTIKNCISGERIKMDYPIIESSIGAHKIQNDFNWTFFRIANTFKTGKNDITVSLPCVITINYSPIIKIGL